jgi:multidrug efflux pump subunit AcrA (membrane-fusion protein)
MTGENTTKRKSRLKILIFILSGIFLLILIAGIIFWGGGEETNVTIQNVEPGEIFFPVKVDVARKGDLIQWINTSGVAKPIQEVDIISRIGGQVVLLNVHNGKFINKDDLIFKIDDTEYKIALKQAEYNLLDARVEYNLMKFGSVPGGADVGRFKKEIDSLRKVL